MLNQKRKYQVTGALVFFLFALWKLLNFVQNFETWQYLTLDDWLFFDILNNQGVFEFLPTPLSQAVVIISLIPDIPWNFFYNIYYWLYIAVTCPMELLNVGGPNCEVSNVFILTLSFLSILFSGYLAGNMILKIKTRLKK